MTRFTVGLTVVLAFAPAIAHGAFEGRVTAAADGASLPDVQIRVEYRDVSKGAGASDANGRFRIDANALWVLRIRSSWNCKLIAGAAGRLRRH